MAESPAEEVRVKEKASRCLVTVKTVVRKLLRTSESLKGYRFIWKVLRDRYQIFVRR